MLHCWVGDSLVVGFGLFGCSLLVLCGQCAMAATSGVFLMLCAWVVCFGESGGSSVSFFFSVSLCCFCVD